jgi:hypothetical protein
VAINIDDARTNRGGTQSELEKAFRRRQIAVRRQQELNGVPGRVDRYK